MNDEMTETKLCEWKKFFLCIRWKECFLL